MSKKETISAHTIHRLMMLLFILPKIKRELSKYDIAVSKGASTKIQSFIVWYLDNNPKHRHIVSSVGLNTLRDLLS